MLAATRLPTRGVSRSAEVAHAPHKMAVRIWQGDGGEAADAGEARGKGSPRNAPRRWAWWSPQVAGRRMHRAEKAGRQSTWRMRSATLIAVRGKLKGAGPDAAGTP